MKETVKLVLHFVYEGEHTDVIYDMFYWSSRLFNQAVHVVKVKYNDTGELLNYYDLDKILKNKRDAGKEIPYRHLPAAVSQHVLKQADGAIKSAITKQHKKQKYSKEPVKIHWPKYKDGYNKIRVATISKPKLKNGKVLIKHKIIIDIPKNQWDALDSAGNFKYRNLILEHTKMFELYPRRDGKISVNIIYDYEMLEPDPMPTRMGAIDLGCHNFITLATNTGRSVVYDGKPLIKEIKRYQDKKGHYQKKLANADKKEAKEIKKVNLKETYRTLLQEHLPRLKSIYMREGLDNMRDEEKDGFIHTVYELLNVNTIGHHKLENVEKKTSKAKTTFIKRLIKSIENKKAKKLTSKRLQNLDTKHNNWMDNAVHQYADALIDDALTFDLQAIVSGYNKNWKIRISLGSKNNQMMAYIPFRVFLNVLEYKCKQAGMPLIITEESYTSKSDALALEPMSKDYKYDDRRIKRGLFESSTGVLVNADINGALNIGRKIYGDEFVCGWMSAPIPTSLTREQKANGFRFNPLRRNVYTVHKNTHSYDAPVST